ncbi:MAG: DUF6428 family protein [Saprospiraceae bacterium]
MKLESFKSVLSSLKTLSFQLPNGDLVPSHFHVTEVGKITKNFIDCGGVIRNEEVVNFQLWQADDYNHRLHPEKLIHIIELSQQKLDIGDLEIEVEYQGETIGKFGLENDGNNFLLITKQTDCLARDKCVVPEKKEIIGIPVISNSCCTSDTDCC